MPLLMGIDAGTTSVKAALFSPDHQMLAVARQEYTLDSPSPERAQLDPEIYWQACTLAVRQVIAQAGASPQEIAALAVSSQGETIIPLDRLGRPLYPAIVWLDNRAASQAANLAAQFGQEIYERTGIPEIIPTWPACKILWLKENEPEVFAAAKKFMLVQDYLVFRLTGRAVTDGSISCTTALYDIRRDDWWPAMLDAAGIQTSQLCEIVPPGSAVGTLTAEAAGILGLGRQVQVVCGGMDQATGAIGAGNISPGIISETTGAALVIQATIDDPGIDQRKIIPVYCHSVPGKYLFAPVCPTAGMALKWLRDTFFQAEIQTAEKEGRDAYDMMTALASEVPPGAGGLTMLPHLMGAFSPVPNPQARGVFAGFTLSHGRGHFVRALLEGIACLLRQNLETIASTGMPVLELRSTGGGARSPLWNQIKADVCHLPLVTVENEEAALLGDAILAGVAAGIFKSIEEGCTMMVHSTGKILPGEQSRFYEAAYRSFCDLDETLAPYFQRNYAA